MHIETERKFLVRDNSYKKEAVNSYRIKQGYIAHDGGNTVRVRIRDNEGFITVKGPFKGLSRPEWEKPISVADAEALLQLCHGGFIDKTRHIIPCGKLFWEVDEFHGRLEGRTLAEIELEYESQEFEKPAFIGEEVTGKPEYYNANM